MNLKIWLLVGTFFLAFWISQFKYDQNIDKRNVKIISVGYHSDTCSDCNVLKAKMKKMNRKFLTAPIVFIKYDKTTEKTQSKSEKELKKWGMLAIAKKEKGLKHVVLYNAKTKESIVTLNYTDSTTDLEKKIKKALLNTP